MNVSVHIEPSRCVASQTCCKLAPGLFELGTQNHAQLTRAVYSDQDLDLLREAEDSCPTGAILIKAEQD